MPVPPDSVTATCVHAPVGSAAGPLIRCSPPDPEVVMANRAVPELLRGVRNMVTVVPVPKSQTRDHVVIMSRRTHVAIVIAEAPLRMPLGTLTKPDVPSRETALPLRPATHEVPPDSVAVLLLP